MKDFKTLYEYEYKSKLVDVTTHFGAVLCLLPTIVLNNNGYYSCELLITLPFCVIVASFKKGKS
jgi:hypothetical protein